MTATSKSTVARMLLGGLAVAVVATAIVITAAADAEPVADWGDCPGGGGTEGLECLRVKVPVDWDEPEGRHVSLLVGRLPATGTAQGNVTVGYGGPGGPAVGALRDRPEVFADLREHMNVVTWDYRGYTSLDGGALCAQRQAPIPAPPTDQTEFDELAEHNRELAEDCRAEDPELFDNMDGASNARDLEAVRKALGDKRLNLLTTSYGGIFAQAYARQYPHRLRTLVLDGTWDHGLPAADQARDQARDNNAILQRFFDWCDTETACELNGTDLPKTWRELVATADAEPIPAPQVDLAYSGLSLRQLALRFAAAGKWPELAAAIAEAREGDASGFAFDPKRPLPTTPSPGMTECLDFARPADQPELETMMSELEEAAPLTGPAVPQLAAALSCVGWPAPVTNPPAALPTEELPPLLGAGTWLEYASTDRAISRVPGSTAIRYDGPGHSLYLGMAEPCVVEHVDAYLVDRTLPEPGTDCPVG